MLTKPLLRSVIEDQLKEIESFGQAVPRTVFPQIVSYGGSSAFVIKGVRRCGKSTLLMQLMRTKFASNFLYFNFDDELLAGIRSEDLRSVMEVLIEVLGDKKTVFFDEIQNVKGWELFVNRLMRQGYSVFITGSNADLLSKELGTHMTGRHTDVELYPFSFAEFLAAKSPATIKQGLYSTSQVALLSRLFKDYLLKGGMPESVVLSNERILTEVVDDIIRRDILTRYSIRKPTELKSVLRFLIANSSNMITYRSVAGNFGVKSSVTIEKYISYAAEAYLLFEVRKFERKLKLIDKNPRKIYCIDSGILVKNSPSVLEHKGAILENVVAVHLKRLGKEFYYYKNDKGHEADFVIPSEKTVIQVCYEINSGNTEREAVGLLEAASEMKAKEAFIVTLEQEQELQYRDKKINVRPAWRWLLETERMENITTKAFGIAKGAGPFIRENADRI